MRDVLTTCCYCGCGCALYLQVRDDRVVGALPSRNHPVSRHNLCVRGWHIHEFIHDPARLTAPLLKKDNEFVQVSWDEALDFAAEKIGGIRNRGDQLGVLASAKCTNEENYLLQKFARATMRTNNIDHCARL